jgi:HK97 family phage portal protein
VGFWDNLLRRPQPVAFFTPQVTHLGADEIQGIILGDLTPAQMWATQPHLRTVVSFLARNIAQLGLHSFRRDGEDRLRDRESPFAATMRRPNSDQTAYDLVYSLVGDLALYDRAYWAVVEDAESSSGWTIRRLPPTWVTPVWRDVFGAKGYAILSPNGESVEVPAANVLAFTGYHPSSPRKGSPTVEALKGTLQEQIEASKYRSQVWKRGGRVSAVIERPKDAPQWSPEAMKQFREDWYAKYTGSGPKAGGTPILEDGMKLTRVDFNAQEQQFVEAAKLSFSTVASAFHVNPTMVGILDNANYSNVREFRRMLYGDTLGPLIAQIEDRINTFLLPMLDMDNAEFYAEFNIAEKLQGSFEEQAAVMQTLVGAPLMTRNEGRARFNLPSLGEAFDEPITPLNVVTGGQASPTDSGSQNLNATGPRHLKARRKASSFKSEDLVPESYPEKAEDVFREFFARQRRVVLSALGAKAAGDWWDGERWDDELADDLYALALTTASEMGERQAEALGFSADDYDPDRTEAFLRKVAESRAGAVNSTTLERIEAALEAGDDVAAVFDEAESSRSLSAGTAILAALAGFALTEAAKQLQGDTATKTWVVNSRNPRSEHAAMSGETVGIDETFSNGAEWPGDPVLGADGVAGCQCTVDITIP